MACKHYGYILAQADRHYIPSDNHNNCVLCLVYEKGPMTQEEVASYFGLSKMRICQIEKKALQKLEKRIAKLQA